MRISTPDSNISSRSRIGSSNSSSDGSRCSNSKGGSCGIHRISSALSTHTKVET